jgi:hypothetical protein
MSAASLFHIVPERHDWPIVAQKSVTCMCHFLVLFPGALCIAVYSALPSARWQYLFLFFGDIRRTETVLHFRCGPYTWTPCRAPVRVLAPAVIVTHLTQVFIIFTNHTIWMLSFSGSSLTSGTSFLFWRLCQLTGNFLLQHYFMHPYILPQLWQGMQTKPLQTVRAVQLSSFWWWNRPLDINYLCIDNSGWLVSSTGL